MSRFAPIQPVRHHPSQFRQAYQYGFAKSTDQYVYMSKPGLSAHVVGEISHYKSEPTWMLEFRLKALRMFEEKPTPTWGGDLEQINYDLIRYYLRPTDKQVRRWKDVPPEIKNTFDRLGIPEAERKALSGVKAQYDCLTSDSAVFTNQGVKRILDIKPGDYVYSLSEKTFLLERQKVLGLAFKGKRKIYKVTTQGGREIRVTANHPFFSLVHYKKKDKKRGRYKKEWRYLSQLREGDLVALAVDFPDHGRPYRLPKIQKPIVKVQSHNQFGAHELDISRWYADLKFPAETDEELMWLLGFYIGDGFLGGKGKHSKGRYMRVELAIPDSEQQLREEVSRVVERLFHYKIITSDKDRVKLNSVQFVQLIEKLGLSGNAHTKRIPDWIFSLPRSQRLSFIGGYFDADGNIRKASTHKNLVFTSVSKELLHNLKLLAISCGLNPSHIWDFSSLQTYKGKKYRRSGFRIQISGDIESVDSRLERKRRLFGRRKYVHRFKTAKGTVFYKHTSDHIGFAKILSIEEKGMEPVYDIEVDGFHNFVADGFIVHNSEIVYGSIKKILEKQGVIFLGMDEGLKKHEDLVVEYFGKLIPPGDNKLAALNSAVWSGGSFVYVPPGVHVTLPLQAYFRINAPNAGQFERTLIIADEGSSVHYVEGCTAPAYSSESLHSAVVEIFVKRGARVQYTTVQNWYKTVYNLVTKRAWVEDEGEMIWTDFNMGSKLTMKYPSFILAGRGARGETLSMAMAGPGQHQDTGSKATHLAPHTTSTIVSKSISRGGGRTSYRGLVTVGPNAYGSRSRVVCDALLLDPQSRSDTYPTNRILTNDVSLEHEATVSKIGEEQLFYLMSRGLSEEEASKMIVSGFVEPLIKKLPLEYAVEMNRLIDMEMEGSVG